MSKVWKWILGIVIGLVVLALIAGAFIVVRNQSMMAFRPGVFQTWPGQPANPNGQTAPNSPYGPRGMMPGWYGHGMRNFGYEGRGFGPFGMGFFFLGGLLNLILPIGVLVLVAYVFYQMGKRAGMNNRMAAVPSAPSSPEAASKGSEPPAGK